MGLSAYGKPNTIIANKLRKFLRTDVKKGYIVNPKYVYYGKRSYSKKFTDKLVKLLGKPRLPEHELTEYHISIAYECQKLLEEVTIKLTKALLRKTNIKNLCISGGVAMNCKMNGVLSNIKGVKNVFINPASHDSGIAIGAPLLAFKKMGLKPNAQKLMHAYWGPSYSDIEIEKLLKHCKVKYIKSKNIAKDVADLLNKGKIIGWFQNRQK